MQPKTLDQFEALVFDVYGTLMDWESGIYEGLRPVLERVKSSWTKQEALLAFYSVELDLEAQHPEMVYSELLAETHKSLAGRLDVKSTPAEDKAFGRSISQWLPFPDTVAALATLKKHYKLIVLSNIDNESFHNHTRPVLEPQGPGTVFDLILTAQDLKAYKPDPATFEAALLAIAGKLGVQKDKVLVTAQSLFHDHKPANALGIHSCYIAREGASIGVDSDATYDFKFATLGEMAEAREAIERT